MKLKVADPGGFRECVVGLDLSLAGTGAVVLDRITGGVRGRLFFTSKKSDVKNHLTPGCVVLLSPEVHRGEEGASWARTNEVAEAVLTFVRGFRPSHVAIEDHAFNAKGASVYQLGHLHGLVRRGLNAELGIPFRLYDPASLKMFATGKGNGEKTDMILAAERDGFECSRYGSPAAGNLADAYWLAKLLRTELALREGDAGKRAALLKDWSISKDRARVFEKVPKGGVELLSRPFLTLSRPSER